MLQGAQQKVQVLVGVNTVIAQNKTIHQEWGECPVPFFIYKEINNEFRSRKNTGRNRKN